MSVIVADRVETQRVRALAMANRARTAAAEARQEIKTGALTAVDALDDPRAGTLSVFGFLVAQRGYGPKRARSTLYRKGIAEGRQVRELSDRQRQVVREIAVAWVRGHR